ncbi:bifunctional 4-hydroxy-2-oxoglutarate aldolase/2-dehydro-3-deoxy-phosphogluconate aldolase [Paenibacillus pasadenensis]|uniref:bifunctional 4-hydroxy-2-oxoglutarate aldolase/2-dehydro-3-deoxy-phosphogluconate aldolase n=1 Tax=Paenibacillus pasadenensis TaxID=217090 RepID=UPI00203F63A3|nr:bifunctional 4-hydroxy-2-oxoglutarate aldolase/2-dehydro-3-deoxy-phosphogluconate aldolase [Paenibacillus pasadenensis]MCM3748692.1 bifunctional 4-hydroxy-2-oxoglutarate aldolase/2-dehydro-3-deoxy-phosphogluconate aldolase [Paenibacillus pasadenensis]
MSSLLDTLKQEKIVAIFRGIGPAEADRAARALADGGIRLMEVTMNTDGALPILSRWREQLDGAAYVGAGTVLDERQAREAVSAGAQFLISPNLDEAVIAYGASQGVSVWPGVMTPTEVVRAWKAGAEAVKIFPMASLGHRYLQELKGPLDHIPMMATGGVDLDNIGDYFRAGADAVGLGSKLVNLQWAREGRFEQMEQRARQFADAVRDLQRV